jgi:hypothetical protein
MKTNDLIIIAFAFFIVVGSISISYAVPELDPQHAFEYSDMVLVGKILSVEILSEPEITRSENGGSERLGVAMYEIEVEKYFKTSSNDQTITVPGLFTREPHAMTYATYPYEQGQRVLLYLQKNTHGYTGTDLIIRLGDSQIVKNFICKEDDGIQGETCVVNGRKLSIPLNNKNVIGSTPEFTDEDICGEGAILKEGVCIVENPSSVSDSEIFFFQFYMFSLFGAIAILPIVGIIIFLKNKPFRKIVLPSLVIISILLLVAFLFGTLPNTIA